MKDPSADRLDRLLSYLERNSSNLVLRKDAIREACEVDRWQTAGELVDVGLQQHPGEPELLALLGYVLLHAELWEDAERALSAAVAAGIDAVEVRYNLAYCRFMERRYSEALGLLNAGSLLQALPLALLLRARCLHHLGRREEATVECRMYLTTASNDAPANGLLALLLYEQQQLDAARGHAEAALKEDPKQQEALLTVALLQADAEDYDNARRSFETLMRASPQCGRAWLGRGLIELSNMQMTAAKQYIEKAAVHMPEHLGTWHVLAWIDILLGDVPAAGAAFEKALALDRNFGETHGGLAVIAAMEGRDEDARLAIKRALRLDPQAMSAQYARMLLLRQQGQHEEARTVLEDVLARPAERGDVLYRDLVAHQIKRLQSMP